MTDDEKIRAVEIRLDGDIESCPHGVGRSLHGQPSGIIMLYEGSSRKFEPCDVHLPAYRKNGNFLELN